MNNLREIAQKFKSEQDIAVYENVPMAQKFSFKIGGTTPLLLEPETETALFNAVNFLKNENIRFFILGGGTNIVFSDNGYDGAVISTAKLNSIRIVTGTEPRPETDTVISVQCGTQMNTLVNFCSKNGLSGLEEFSGLPGTAGGACYMNARCFNREISQVVCSVEYLSCELNSTQKNENAYSKKTLVFNEKDWAYKISPFTDKNCIILSVQFSVKQEPKEKQPEITQKAAGFMKQRVEKGHFKFPCAGSIFKNNHDFGEPTGQIIDELGLKGYSIGGAQIAPWHGNIIINNNNASSENVRQLIEYIQQKVKKEKGFSLEPEVLFY